MKCKICGSDSGKYLLCYSCNKKREQGIIIKCNICGQWHYKESPCPQQPSVSDKFLYDPRKSLISKTEQAFFDALKANIPENYHVFPQINLAAFICKTDKSLYQNELFRNVDFLITNNDYAPKIAVEINDKSHTDKKRRERDERVQKILEEAGIPIIKLWTSYGVNPEYIKNKINEALISPPARRHNFIESVPALPEQHDINLQKPQTVPVEINTRKKRGCYIATCVYNSYDCPPVWVLRRYRDNKLSASWHGKLFIKLYYSISPSIVKIFGNSNNFKLLCRRILDRKVHFLKANGYNDSPYQDI